MKKEEKQEPIAGKEKVYPAGFGKSIAAYLLDAAITIICIVIGYFSASPICIEHFEVGKAKAEGRSFYEDSHLVYFDENEGVRSYYGLTSLTDGSGEHYYAILEEAIWHYYVEFLALDERCDFSSVAESKSVDAAEKYVYEKIYGIDEKGDGNAYYLPKKNEDGSYSFSSRPVLKDGYKSAIDSGDGEIEKKILEAYINTESGYYLTPFDNLTNGQGYLAERINRINDAQRFALLPSAILFPVVFFFLIPLINKDGKTIGKMIFSLRLSSRDLPPLRFWQKFVHYGVILSYWLLILVSGVWIVMILAIFASIIDYLVRIINRSLLSLHDLLAHTVVIDTKKSERIEEEETSTPNKSWEDNYIHKASEGKKEAEEDERLYEILDMKTMEEAEEKKEEWRKKETE